MPHLSHAGRHLPLSQVREVTTSITQIEPLLAQNGLDEVLFEAEGKTYLGVSESLELGAMAKGSAVQVTLDGVERPATVLATQDDITGFAEGWAKGKSLSDSWGKAIAGLSSSPEWEGIHAHSQSVGRWPVAATPSPPSPPVSPAPESRPDGRVNGPYASSSDVEVFFTTPGEGHLPAEKLAAFIRSAERTVDVAAFELESATIRDAILDAHAAGRQVRVVTDSNYKDEPDIKALQAAGVPVIDDQRSGLMHNKFVVIDEGLPQAAVFTGSMNFTDNGVERNNNNVLILRSQALAENYGTEFREMFEDRSFGRTSPDGVPHPDVTVGHSRIETYFSAEGDVAGRVAEALATAQTSIRFMAFSYTHDDINAVVMDKMAQGVTVRGVFDNTQAGSKYSKYHDLKAAGADVRRDGNPRVMHHKVFIIDEKTVITGSFNFSASANKSNDENLLIIEDEAIAQQYLQEFKKVYGEAKPE